jgi:hypothetical protein
VDATGLAISRRTELPGRSCDTEHTYALPLQDDDILTARSRTWPNNNYFVHVHLVKSTHRHSTMAPYFGLRGTALSRAIIWLVVCPAFLTYGYNQGVMGGLLTLKSFAETFPDMNTLTTHGEKKHYNSTIQGKCAKLQ